jgi:predicted transcriptional regulator
LRPIILPHGMGKEIARCMKISETAVCNYLRGRMMNRKDSCRRGLAVRRLAELKLQEYQQQL